MMNIVINSKAIVFKDRVLLYHLLFCITHREAGRGRKLMISKPGWIAVAIAITLAVVLLGATVYSATSNILVEGTIPDSQMFDGSVRVTVRELTIKPGEAVPLHYHPGHVFIVVKSGTLTVEDGCGEEKKLSPGQGLEEMNGRVHRGKNV